MFRCASQVRSTLIRWSPPSFRLLFLATPFALIVGVALNGLSLPVTLVTYAVMVFGTATVNCILVAILTLPLKKVLKLR